jgi:hypothetical protein
MLNLTTRHWVLVLLVLRFLVSSVHHQPAIAGQDLPRDPYDAVRLENDVLGVRLWGPPGQPTLSLGKSDVWDRRWFGDRQPVVTLQRLRELAKNDRLADVAASPNGTIYDVYGEYDFPCPKPAAQAILGTPFASSARVEPDGIQAVRLTAAGHGKELVARICVAADRSLVIVQCQTKGMGPENLLLSYQSLHVFPAVPPGVEVEMAHFAAEGGFRVSAVRSARGETRDVCIESTLGGPCRLASP